MGERKIIEELPELTAMARDDRFGRYAAQLQWNQFLLGHNAVNPHVDDMDDEQFAAHQAIATAREAQIFHDTWWGLQNHLARLEARAPSLDACEGCGRPSCLYMRPMIGGMFPERAARVPYAARRFRHSPPPPTSYRLKTWAREQPWWQRRMDLFEEGQLCDLMQLVRKSADSAGRALSIDDVIHGRAWIMAPARITHLHIVMIEMDLRDDGTVKRWRYVETNGRAPMLFGWKEC